MDFFLSEVLGLNPNLLYVQLVLGLINGAFYAVLSLGLALIFGLLNVINFAHGAQFMMGAFVTWMLLEYLGIPYWVALILAPASIFIFGVALEKALIRHTYKLDHLYGLLLTFGLSLILEGLFREGYGVAGQPYDRPDWLSGGVRLQEVVPFLPAMFLPASRVWVLISSVVVCLTVWLVVERTKLGAYLRAATENPALVQAFGVNVPLMVTMTYAFGAALAAYAGVLAAVVYSVNPLMGSNLIIIVFAVVVIGGMGSILGAIVTGFALGMVEGITRAVYSEASSTVVFVIMAIVLLTRPQGLFGKS